ncbi:FAD:protein FMN transferase [Wenxinia marina]|uniref:FAD:protein FMN transferase n=1 Tax=Wenxinia marina DSM 24838 TaxID=1123501 RepID=A0A0D0PIP1_9RHOB|nr:FAD:protein FMN transferase [Wenxinia marina]KIQ71211.1 Membrane-associated lipoprotein involved in thiamine biosynthesis [Wenxinia marina DSM 24838]GGL81583.1 FAD:protein FMN transferase [Wenxinia marina]
MSPVPVRPTRRTVLLGLAGGILSAPAIARAAAVRAVGGQTFGTTWSLTAAEGAALDDLGAGIEALFRRFDRALSPWRPDSEISRWNAAPAGWRAADGEFARVARAALDLARDSAGCFDPTVGPLVARWGWGPIEGSGEPNWRGVIVGGGGIGKARDGLTLDLCGIAKGRALDLAAGLVREAGLRDALLDLGGELVALGRHPSGREWRVAVEAPAPGAPAPAALRLPPGAAVATSGLRHQSYALGGRTWGHIIDPASAAPASGALRSVTVLGESAMLADGWATALFAAGDSAGPALARERGLSALFVSGPAAPFRLDATGGMEDHLL